MRSLLDTLRDVPGVVGSFAAHDDGHIVANAMPGYVELDDMESAAQRIQWLVEGASELEVRSEWCVVYFEHYRLHVASFVAGRLVVLAEPQVNVRALRMAAKIVCRKLERLTEADSGRPSSLPSFGDRDSQPSVRTFEVRGQGRLSEPPRETPESTPSTDLRHTQPSLTPPQLVKSPEVASPEGRASQRKTGPRSMVYRGRRYDVSS